MAELDLSHAVGQSLGPKPIHVWDAPTRIYHWGVGVIIILLFLSGMQVLGMNRGLHMFLGELTLAAVLFRVIWGFVGSETARFANFVKGPKAIMDYMRDFFAGRPYAGVGHNPMGAYMFLALMLAVLVTACLGLFNTDGRHYAGPFNYMISPEATKVVQALHPTMAMVVFVLACIHIATALYYKYGRKDDIITPMVTGWQPEKVEGQPQPFLASGTCAFFIFVGCLVVVFGAVLICGR